MPKNKKAKQTRIAEEVTDQEIIRKLRRQIKLMHQMPKDFRDLSPGSPKWEAFAETTGRRHEMELWSNGPVLCIEEPNELERRILGEIYQANTISWSAYGPITWLKLFTLAQEQFVSWIYLPNEEGGFIQALNQVCSRMGTCFRIKGQLLSERTGKPLGVVR